MESQSMSFSLPCIESNIVLVPDLFNKRILETFRDSFAHEEDIHRNTGVSNSFLRSQPLIYLDVAHGESELLGTVLRNPNNPNSSDRTLCSDEDIFSKVIILTPRQHAGQDPYEYSNLYSKDLEQRRMFGALMTAQTLAGSKYFTRPYIHVYTTQEKLEGCITQIPTGMNDVYCLPNVELFRRRYATPLLGRFSQYMGEGGEAYISNTNGYVGQNKSINTDFVDELKMYGINTETSLLDLIDHAQKQMFVKSNQDKVFNKIERADDRAKKVAQKAIVKSFAEEHSLVSLSEYEKNQKDEINRQIFISQQSFA